jgi:hypothetical protein
MDNSTVSTVTVQDILKRLDTVINKVSELSGQVVMRSDLEREFHLLRDEITIIRDQLNEAPSEPNEVKDVVHPALVLLAGSLVGGTLIELIKVYLLHIP